MHVDTLHTCMLYGLPMRTAESLAARGLIGEISFYAFGFEKGRHLAKKMARGLGNCEHLETTCQHGRTCVRVCVQTVGIECSHKHGYTLDILCTISIYPSIYPLTHLLLCL